MIQIIVGTNRPESNTRKIADQVSAIYKAMGRETGEIDLADLPPDIFSPTAYAEKPASFEPMARAVVEADGLVVITPEYNGAVPGVLKYFIDMLKFPESFDHKPVCFIGLAAGDWGGMRPVEHLQQIFGYRHALIYPLRVFLPGIGNLLDEEGGLKDEELRKRLERQARGFGVFVDSVGGLSGD